MPTGSPRSGRALGSWARPARAKSGARRAWAGGGAIGSTDQEGGGGLAAEVAALKADLAGRARRQRASDDELGLALEAGRFGVVRLDPAGDASPGLFSASPLARTQFGRDPGRPMTAADFTEALHPDDRARVLAALAGAHEGGSVEVEFRVAPGERGSDRGLRWLAIRARAVLGGLDGGARLVGVSLDVTDARRAERQRRALADLAQAFDGVGDAGAVSWAAGRLLGAALEVDRAGYGTIDALAETVTIERDWNAPGVASLAGTLRFRDYGSYIDDLLKGDTVAFEDARTDPRTVASAAGLEAISARAAVNLPVVEGGRTVAIFYLSHGRPRAWREDEIEFLREVAQRTRVMVERRRAELALRESAGRLMFLDEMGRATVAATDPDAVMATTTRLAGEHLAASICAYADMDPDQDGFTIRGDWSAEGSPSIVGRYALRGFGPLAVERLGAGLPLVVDDIATELDPVAAATFQSIGIGATIVMPLVKEGRLTALMAVHDRWPRRWTEADVATVGEVAARSWAHIERVRAEAELRASASALLALNETLESRVEERSRRLVEAEEALRQAQKMEAVGQLTGGLAHDFNNLLAGIGGSLEMIEARLAQGRPEAVARYAATAQEAVRRASALTHRLLAFSRRQPLDPRPTDVGRLAAGLADLVVRTVGPAIELEVTAEPGLWPTLVDPNQLENALLNLAINARDAMPGGGRLSIAAGNASLAGPTAGAEGLEPGDYVALRVRDTGTGMTPEVAARAFDPFFTTKPMGTGTGLGLSMIYGFARQSGGSVRIETAPGQGTTMVLFLPRHAEGPASDVRPVAVGVGPARGQGEAVLVVDDDATVRMLAAEALRDAGYAVTEAGDGAEALAILAGGAPVDLLVTDIGLPGGLSGRDLAVQARQARPRLPVLFITGFDEAAVLGSGRLAPGMSLLAKPFRIEDLSRRVREALAG